MTKIVNGISGRRTYTASGGFHVPHDRKATWATGELVNHKTGEVFTPPSRTKQQFVAECDINNILKQYKLTGQVRHISAKAAQGSYTDLPDPIDFQDAMNMVIRAEDSFATLPAHVRARFGNSPEQFLVFMADPANQDEMVKLGLASDPRTAPTAPSSPAASSPTPSPSTPSGGEKTGPSA
jgi:phage internal scaffolding protein